MKRVADIIHLKYAHDRGILGRGIGVAVVDTGISMHPDLTERANRIVAFKDFINSRDAIYDDNGHGTHVSGIIGGNGYSSNGYYMGVAPMCHLIGVKVLNFRGSGSISDVLKGMEWIIQNKDRYNIRVVNISVGTPINKEQGEDSILIQSVNAVWDAGIVVLAAAGNNGPRNKTIGAPGISRKIITVGASDDNERIDIQGTMVKDYSGRGPTNNCIKKPDIVAPGSNVISCNAIKNIRQASSANMFAAKKVPYTNMYATKSGTSMSTPIASGAIALLLSRYPHMTPREVKIRLKNSAMDLGRSHDRQGWGMIDIERLLG